MGKYVDKDQWLEEVLIPDTSTSILGGQPVWEGDRLIDGFANISTAILADRTRHLKNKVDSLEFSVDVDFKNVLRKENNLSDLLDIQQAKYNLELNLVDNVRDMDKPVSNQQQAALNLKADKATTISVGAGLTGGGNLSANRTITLGTPSTITGSTTNQSTTGTHTHALSIGIADVSGLTSALAGKEPTLTAGTATQYYRGDKTWQTLNTGAVAESTNLYFTENRVRSAILAGFSVGANSAIVATDNVLTAFNKTQGQINYSRTLIENHIAAPDPHPQYLFKTATAVAALKLETPRTITMGGDLTGSVSFDGSTDVSAAITLSNSGVTAGTYTKATVDSKGRVVSGTTLSASDIPNLDWSKITSGKPTTLAGYGITDGLVLGNVAGSTPGTASAGTATTAARSDHVHPIQTTVSGNAGTATRLATARTINGVSFDGTANITINAVDSTARIAVSEKGVANGVATLDSTGTIPSSQLPSYVDDVLEYANLAAFPTTGEQGKIYIARDTGFIYRWSGSTYIWINASAGSADTALKLAQARTIAATGDASWSVTFDGSSNATAAITLSNSGVTAGTYNNVATQVRPFTVDAKGRITGIGTAVTITPAFTSITGRPTTLSGYGITDAAVSNHNHTLDSLSNVTITSNTSGEILRWNGSQWVNATLAEAGIQPSGSYLTGNQNITVTGDATGSGTTSIALTLANSGVTAGTYTKTTVDAKGRVTAGTSLVAGDIPNLDAGKITSGTLADARLPTRLGVVCKTITDWNTATENGYYMASNGTNAPSAEWYMGDVVVHNSNWVTQTVHGFSSESSADTKTYRRERNNGTWSSWYRLRISEAEQSAIYLNASNLNAGTIPDARLSGTYTGVNITGNAETATKLATARQINGVNFDGTANITIADSTKLPLSGGTLSGSLGLHSVSTSEIKQGTGDGASYTTYNIAIRSWWGIGFRDYTDNATVKAYIDCRNGVYAGQQFKSDIATGTAPLLVTSSTLVNNLNSDLLDGQHGSYYLNASNLNAGTVPTARIPSLQATKAQVLNGTSNLYVSGSTYQSFISWNALGTVSTGNVTIDLDAGINFTLTVGGNITIVNPTNADAGKSGDIYITMSAAGVVSWGTNWKFLNKVPEIGANGELWMISYKVVDASNIIACASKVAT